jgi:hypothetical protein
LLTGTVAKPVRTPERENRDILIWLKIASGHQIVDASSRWHLPLPEEATTMDRLRRLHLMARSTYYLGWITAFLAALLHVVRLDRLPLNISTRNLLEASFLFFLVCAASELRAQGVAADEMVHPARGQAA